MIAPAFPSWLFLLAAGAAQESRPSGEPRFPLQPSADRRSFVDAQGRPFLYHADTAWNLPKKLTLKETHEYLDDRKARGFTALQIQAVSKEQGAMANRDGHDPFAPPEDILKPNEPYWRHLDALIGAVRERGFLLAVAPLWIRWGGNDREGWRRELTDANARAYGRFLGRRYRDFDNLLWILGGDANPGDRTRATSEMALGIREEAPRHFLTYHAAPDHSSARWFGNETWLDVNGAYTYRETPLHVSAEWAREPARPIVLLESGYEDESNDKRGGSPLRMRRQVYQAIFSGSTGGHAFGQKHVWRFDAEWRKALDSPATRQMVHAKNFLVSKAWFALAPEAAALAGGRGDADAVAVAARSADGRRLLVYLPQPRALKVDLSRLAGPARGFWFDPTDGKEKAIEGSPFENRGTREFIPPEKNAAGEGDFVLVLEAAP